MNICFYFALRTSTLICSVLILSKEYYPIRSLIELLTVISKIYYPRLNVCLKLITRTSTAWFCVCVYAIYICLKQKYEGKWLVAMYCSLPFCLIFSSGQRGKNRCSVMRCNQAKGNVGLHQSLQCCEDLAQEWWSWWKSFWEHGKWAPVLPCPTNLPIWATHRYVAFPQSCRQFSDTQFTLTVVWRGHWEVHNFFLGSPS